MERRYLWRRGAERIALELPVRWGADESCVHRGLLTSLSTKGGVIEAPVVSLPHERICMRLPDGAGAELPVTGEVAYYVSGRGVAFQFVFATEAEREALARLVRHYRQAANGG